MRLLVLIVLCLLCSHVHIGTAQETEPNGCPSSTPILNTTDGTCNKFPDDYTVITDSTSYLIVQPQNEEIEVTLQEFVIYFSPYILNGTYQLNAFTYILQEPSGAVASFSLLTKFSFFLEQDDVGIVPNTLLGSNLNILEIGTYFVTLLVAPVESSPFPIVNFTVTIVEDPCMSNPCVNGNCNISGATYTCDCYPGYNGTNCSDDLDPCNSSPCDNGGTCTMNSPTEFSCQCLTGYTGTDCSVNIDDCDGVSCGSGSCVDEVNDYHCDCDVGYSEDGSGNCTINIDDCAQGPCDNGLCQDEVNGFTCNCYPGYTGTTCDTDIDDCNPIPCDFVGFNNFVDGNQTCFCYCRSGFTGDLCGININDCDPNLCQNNGTCEDGIASYTCDCAYGYTGKDCETVIDFCADSPCNNGSCTSVEAVGFTCECDPGYTSENCSQEINECASNPCIKGSTCLDQINSFTCVCQPNYTGTLCDIQIVNCDDDPCQNNATCTNTADNFICSCQPDYTGMTCGEKIDNCAADVCINGICVDGINDFTCVCNPGFTGTLCENDIEICELEKPCLNGGSCIDLERLKYNCTCADGYFGTNCTEDISECNESAPCQNGGTCTDGPGLNYTCGCPDGFDGANCENDIDVCNSNPCSNNGTCINGYGLAFNCTCAEGFEGNTCDTDIDACLSDPCKNGGSCQDQPGPGLDFTCSCSPGFSGLDCGMDLDFCNNTYCQNGGTCVDGEGVAISCSCSIDYTGEKCETELTFCASNLCQNGGTCMEDSGNQTFCVCVEGFEGDLCHIDGDYCNSTTCSNGGTCMEGTGTETSCMCSVGFDGDNCQIDVDFCLDVTCSNGGTCEEGYGNITTCICTDIYTGDNCLTPFCPDGYCNNGTCDESTDPVFCNCLPGYKGPRCEDDIDFCITLPCLNDATCMDGPSVLRTCFCPPTFTGEDCGVPVCQDNSCNNEGTCVVIETELICHCPPGFNGSSCENDLDFCNNTVCLNGGTCEESYGNEISCNCSDGFDGDYCQTDLDFCNENPCNNGGTCEEGYGPTTTCDCPDIYSGDRCQTPFCPDGYCNNGTCDESTDPVSCNCFPGYTGGLCETDINYCGIDPCQNGGNCVDGPGTNRMCYCPPNFTGASCETPVCQQDSCENGGTCSVQGAKLTCLCPAGFTGPTCGIDINNICDSGPCKNGGSCSEGVGASFSCVCPEQFTGITCETPLCSADSCSNGGTCDVQGGNVVCVCPPNYTGPTCDTYTPCSPSQCLNGGTCVVNNTDNSFSCLCTNGYSGTYCQTILSNNCTQDSDCVDGFFCEITCASDSYSTHTALLNEAINLQGITYVTVETRKYPDFSGAITVFAVFKQDLNNQGYILFYGTSGNDRNFAIFLDNDTELTFFYLTKDGVRNSIKIDTNWNKFEEHSLIMSIDASQTLVSFYLDDAGVIVRILDNPDFTALISDTKPASLLVGARLPHHFRFSGQIQQVIFFQSEVSTTTAETLRIEFDSLVNPTGQCRPYLQDGDSCPTPTTAPSSLCISSTNKCDPTLKCLVPSPGSGYSCQPIPAPCTSDNDCSSGYFCGDELPSGGSNYFESPEFSLPGENNFLLEPTMQFDGEQIVSLPADYQPQISSELTIFAVVTQEKDNDGYVVGKGLNDRMRDFGLYLRSSQNVVWLAYGADEEGDGFREILYFYDVNIADGKSHTLGAVVSGAANRAVLYVDGKAVSQQSPLPSVPTFRPGYNLLYVGGRPGTKRFRFKGTIKNLFVSTAPLQADSIEILHEDAMDDDGKLNLLPPTRRFCRQYISAGSQCELVNSDVINNFRCAAPAECVPIQDSSSKRVLPDINAAYAALGTCITPCDCSDQPESLVCGSDGNTYANSCYRECALVTEFSTGACT